jgi:uroporphyrinogen decarboxylase
MDDLVGAGYKGYQSIQATAGMDWAWLKKAYGQQMTLWTGVQCETLIKGTRREVEEEVRKGLDVLMPSGGFIFGSTNSIQYGANTDNYLYALDLVRKYGIY